MKKFITAIPALLAAALLCSCADTAGTKADTIAGKTFVWEKEGFGGDFTITLNEDGTYGYYEGFLSSYIGAGKWTEENGRLTLTETSGYDFVFRFDVKDGELVYVSDGSDGFIYTKVENGDRFIPQNTN
ncbi:MAG: hypothetical protein II820_09245 [Ruminiclostridium sp.]|nr:hypothetical protein [Ruminiclostridium sp.]